MIANVDEFSVFAAIGHPEIEFNMNECVIRNREKEKNNNKEREELL